MPGGQTLKRNVRALTLTCDGAARNALTRHFPVDVRWVPTVAYEPDVKHLPDRPQPAPLDLPEPQPTLGDLLQPGHRDGVERLFHRRIADRLQRHPNYLDSPPVVTGHRLRRIVQPRSRGNRLPLTAPHPAPAPLAVSPHTATGAPGPTGTRSIVYT